MSTLTVRLDPLLQKELDRESKALRLPRSEVVRQAIKDYLHRRETKLFRAAIVKAANATDPRENKLYSEEGLEWGDRALSMAEVFSPLPRRKAVKRRTRP